MTDRIRIFDTTLRDGEQAPGFSMTVDSKLRMAKALAALKVDVIEELLKEDEDIALRMLSVNLITFGLCFFTLR